MSLYDELGVPKDADPDSIKRAYRKQAHKAHPDKGGSSEKFHAIQVAYEVLGDPAARRRYDETGSTDKAPDIRHLAMVNIAALLLQAVGQHDVDHTDLRELLVKNIEHGLRQTKIEIDKVRQLIIKRKKAIRRLKQKKGAQNVLAEMLENDVKSQEARIVGLEDGNKLGAEMLRVLADYEYSADQAAGAFPTFTRTTFNPYPQNY